ncbi:Hypothetical protein CINCED_3A000096 [Cinara cedri]|uniref:Uncharacterized protein n=1 Tax=Cinara cedri TaxID=506608 RepID=A0A5E4N6A0_9HEMI|nr:Hypothetical protein CINCED_3A000096 [Cinara cedri]
MVLSCESSAVFDTGKEIPVTGIFQDEQHYWVTKDSRKQSRRRIRSAFRSLRVETIQTELQLSL